MTGPDPNKIHPNENIQQIVYIKNVITRPNIIVGEYSYYDDVNGAERFEEHVTHHYEFWVTGSSSGNSAPSHGGSNL